MMYFEPQQVEFANRKAAGQQLAAHLVCYAQENPLVIGLPRGGVVVAYEVAHALRAELDTVVVRKLGAPDQPELGIGAVVDADHPQITLYDDLVRKLGVSREHIDREVNHQLEEIRRREHEYRADRPPPEVRDRTVILVDDGIATGSTIRAALRSLRARRPRQIIVAAPVAAPETLPTLEHEADAVVVLAAPSWFRAVGQFYIDFGQTSDQEVINLLNRAGSGPCPPASVCD